VEQRIARLLLDALDRCDSGEVAVTQEVISKLLGVRRTTVTTAARRLRQEGMIRYHRGHIVFANRVRLQELACECYETCRRRMETVLSPPQSRPELAELGVLQGGIVQIP
jgi:DNA-binding GntR family transcriptional regulator